jgi:fructose-bisphosphate aldolase class I
VCCVCLGILAADESTGTIGKRFDAINLENTQENRRAYRKLLFTAPGLNKHIGGVITYEETLLDKDESGKPLIEYLHEQNILVGIKVDMGTRALPFTDNETYTQGLTDLDKRTASYYEKGARFAKWRAVVRIGANSPSQNAIQETAWTLARYAAICQANGLVPIVEPEILMDGDHTLAVCQYWTEKVITACYKALSDQNVMLEGTLLKPNMVNPGQDCKERASVEQVATATVTALQRSVPPAVPGITFLSGGQSEQSATAHLNAMNGMKLGARPWAVTFSFGRALQKSCIAAWQGKSANNEAAQAKLMFRARSNNLAAQGKYTGEGEDQTSSETIFVKNYTY